MVDDAKALSDSKARKEAVAAAQKQQLDAQLKAREEMIKANNEKAARDLKLRPTPTPEELLKSMNGQNPDEKEPDGSPEQNMYHPVLNAAQQIEVGNKMLETKPIAVERGYTTKDVHPAAKPAVKPNP